MLGEREQLRLESQMSNLEKIKPQKHPDESRAAYYWRVIRASVREATTLVKQADIREILVGHGVHHGRQLNHPQAIHHMAYNKKTKEYLTVDDKFVRVFMEDGRKKDIIAPEEPINRVLFASYVNLYIGWNFNSPQIMLLNSDFDVVSMNESPGPIFALAYNENINEVVTVGPGYITSWVFRYGGRHLLPRKTTTEGLTEKDMFSMLVLEETASRTQKGYAACNTGVAVFNLYEGTCLSYERSLHTRAITCMTYFNPLKYLVTGSRDGSIKVWDEQWHLQLAFVGHSGSVLSVASFPYGPHIMSTSDDCTLRVWSLETCDQVDQVKTKDPVEYLGTNINQDNIFSYSKSHADLWKVQHIHTLHTTVGHKVQKIKCTDHPRFPMRSLLMCRDSSVRIISPTSGDVITTLLQRPKRNLVDAAYAIAEDVMFAVFADGTIVKCDTSTNPCTVKDQWICKDNSEACNYLLVYEYVITADMDSDIWSGMQRAIATKSVGTSSGKSRNTDRTLLLGGRKDGQICVFDWNTGKIDFQIEAHGSKGVLSMVANSKADQLISAGLDNIIKLWRLYPYAQESLAPLMSFYCGHTPVHMSIMKNNLAVAFQEHSTATYSVVLYNLMDRNRYDHEPGEDHMDSISGLTCCPKMKMFASSSHDGTVRIWSNKNKIIRLLKLNACPHSLAFCNDKGDLLVGIGKHLHKISYKNYMPKAIRFKMMSMEFRKPEPEKPIPYDENLLNMLHVEDVKRLKAARSSFK